MVLIKKKSGQTSVELIIVLAVFFVFFIALFIFMNQNISLQQDRAKQQSVDHLASKLAVFINNLYVSGDGTVYNFTFPDQLEEYNYTVEIYRESQAVYVSIGDIYSQARLTSKNIHTQTLETGTVYTVYNRKGWVEFLPISFQNSLMGWWRANGNADDSSQYENDGTLVDDAHTFTQGYSGGVFTFDGSGDYVLVSDAPELHVGDATLSFLLYINHSASDVNWRNILSKVNATYREYLIAVQGNGAGKFRLHMSSSTDTAWSCGSTSDYVLDDHQFYHVFITRNISTGSFLTKYYVDGVLSAMTTTCAGSTFYRHVDEPFHIGTSSFDGMLDEVVIWNRTLTDEEIMQYTLPQYPVDCATVFADNPDAIEGMYYLDADGYNAGGAVLTNCTN